MTPNRRLWRPQLDAVAPYDAGKPLEALREELGVEHLVRLSANESPLGPSPHVIEVLRAEAARVHLYPDGGSSAVRRALGAWVGVPPDWLVAGNGADEVLTLIARAAFAPGDEIVMPDPSFEPYGIETELAGAVPVRSPLAGYDTDLDDMLRRVTPRTKAVFLCTPHNPASTLVPEAALERFLRELGEKTGGEPPLVVIDEAYRDFAEAPTADGADLARRYPTVIALRTFSKIAGLAGLRLGYAIAVPATIERLNRVRSPYNVNRLAQVAAVAALEDRAHLEATRALVVSERRRLIAALRGRGVPVPDSQANFLLPRIGGRAAELRGALLRVGILVRDGASVGFPGHLRISIGRPEQNDALLGVLDSLGLQSS
ncbi:MAG: histidinol-phosphate transaminase [Candidatus Rokubacteria bacterium]|nr:histidinol-phosphate transaminase [Candidatus Rokubacteria bacterium]